MLSSPPATSVDPSHRRTLSRRASFWVAAAVVVQTLWASVAPTMSYPLYAAQWHLSPRETTTIFAVFPIVVVTTLICLGDLSDYIGRRSTMLIGMALSFVGIGFFAIAPSVAWLYVGRVFMGVGVGMSAGSSAAAMIEFSAPGKAKLASAITASAQALGLGMTTILCGALIQYAPYPTHLNFYVLCLLVAIVFVATWFMPRHTAKEMPGRWRIKGVSIPPHLRIIFFTSVLAVATGYMVGGTLMSVGAMMARDLIHSSNSLVNGLILAWFAIVGGIAGIAGKNLAHQRASIGGALAAIVGAGVLALSSAQHSIQLFLLAATIDGIAYSLLFAGGLNLISLHSGAKHRGSAMSALFLGAYLLQGSIALFLGFVATAKGLDIAIDAGTTVVALTAALSIAVTLKFASRPPVKVAA